MDFLNFFKKKNYMIPRVLLESKSPNCDIQAIVEEDNRCVYFYLHGEPLNQGPYMQSCWVRNYGKAPRRFDINAMKEGVAPMLFAEGCSHPDGADKIDPTKLSIVWFEEGDGAALFYKEEVLSIIPCWTNNEYPPYSKDCVKATILAMPLGSPSENVLFERIKKAKFFWENKKKLRAQLEASRFEVIEKSIGNPSQYFSIDGGKWPPKSIVTVEKDNVIYLFTISVSLIPQPRVEMHFEQPERVRRFELGFAIEKDLFSKNCDSIVRYITDLTAQPWNSFSWLTNEQIVSFKDVLPAFELFPFILLLNNSETSFPAISYPNFRGDEINLLWMIPVTEEEKTYMEKNGRESLFLKLSDNLDEPWIFRGNPKFGKEVNAIECKEHYIIKERAIQCILGKMHNTVSHALFPFKVGGSVDMYYFPEVKEGGTAFATMEFIDPDGSALLKNSLGNYEMVAFTRCKISEWKSTDDAFGRIERRTCATFTDLGHYAKQTIINPGETIEIPRKKEGNKYIIFDEYLSENKFKINQKTHGLLLIIEIFKEEMEFAMQKGSKALFEKLKKHGHYPFSDLDRKTVI